MATLVPFPPGHEIALQFKEQGITSIVLKYRTNTKDNTGKRPYPREVYLPAATADAKEAIRILRSQAQALNIDPNKIGVGGFSAGGHLSLSVLINPDEPGDDTYPDFAYLIYPWLQKGYREEITNAQGLPPIFIVNGQEDTATPADTALLFYQILYKKKVPAELHIYSKGGHGYGLRKSDHPVSHWPQRCGEWLAVSGLLEKKK